MATATNARLMAATCRKAPAATRSRPVHNQRRRNMNRTDAVSGSIMKISVFEASSRGLPAAVRRP
jgi:hypothetical protein